MKDLVIADRIDEAVTALGDNPNRPLDERGANALFFATTAAMLDALLAAGVDPRVVLVDGTSVLDAPAREGQLAMVRSLLAVAPELATEELALLAADHPRTEELIRAFARGAGSTTTVAMKVPVELRRVPTSTVLPTKGSQRYHFPQRPGHIAVATLPADVRARVPASADVFRGHGDSVLVFRRDGGPRLITPDREIVFDVPSVNYPFEHAFTDDGSHYFFAYGQMRVIGIEVATRTIVVDEALPGGPWGTVMVSLPGESNQGHTYPIRVAVSGEWLAITSLERIVFQPFGSMATKATRTWFTCQLGTCAASVMKGRVFVIGARAGSAAYGVEGARVLKLCDLAPPAKNDDPVAAQIRMILRVSGKGHDDPRTVEVVRTAGGTMVRAYGHAGFDKHEVVVPALEIDESSVSSAPVTSTEIVDAYEEHGRVVVRVSPIGSDRVESYEVTGLEELWDASFGTRESVAIEGDALIARKTPLPPPIAPPHRDMGQLSYPTVGRAGYGIGYKVSARPGLWNTYVVGANGVAPLKPHWFNGVTYEALHDSEPRAVLASGREAIEIDLANATWKKRDLQRAVRGICYFEAGIALLLDGELQFLPAIDATPTRTFPTTAREAQLASFHDRRVLWVPTAGSHDVLLAHRGTELVVLGLIAAGATGECATPEGAFLKLASGALELLNFEKAIASALPYNGEPLHELRLPVVDS